MLRLMYNFETGQNVRFGEFNFKFDTLSHTLTLKKGQRVTYCVKLFKINMKVSHEQGSKF